MSATNGRTKRQNGPLPYVILEVALITFTWLLGRGSLENIILWGGAFQLMAIIIGCAIFWTDGHRGLLTKPGSLTNQPNRNAWIFAFGLVIAMITALTCWFLGVTVLMRNAVKHDGVSAVATVQQYELYQDGTHGAEIPTSSASSADGVNVTLEYNGHTAKVTIQVQSPAFYQVVNDKKVPVRYLRWLPSIVYLQSDLKSTGSN